MGVEAAGRLPSHRKRVNPTRQVGESERAKAMTTKTISGTYSGGYLLHSNYSTVSITSSGSIGGFGLITQAATVDNSGRPGPQTGPTHCT